MANSTTSSSRSTLGDINIFGTVPNCGTVGTLFGFGLILSVSVLFWPVEVRKVGSGRGGGSRPVSIQTIAVTVVVVVYQQQGQCCHVLVRVHTEDMPNRREWTVGRGAVFGPGAGINNTFGEPVAAASGHFYSEGTTSLCQIQITLKQEKCDRRWRRLSSSKTSAHTNTKGRAEILPKNERSSKAGRGAEKSVKRSFLWSKTKCSLALFCARSVSLLFVFLWCACEQDKHTHWRATLLLLQPFSRGSSFSPSS